MMSHLKEVFSGQDLTQRWEVIDMERLVSEQFSFDTSFSLQRAL